MKKKEISKRKKEMLIELEKGKLPLFAYDMILYKKKKTKASPKIVKTSRWILENSSKQNQYAKVSNTLYTSDKLPKSNSFKTVTGACLWRKSHLETCTSQSKTVV